jgi:hypothetical protein
VMQTRQSTSSERNIEYPRETGTTRYHLDVSESPDPGFLVPPRSAQG